jgi:hypothetical protein
MSVSEIVAIVGLVVSAVGLWFLLFVRHEAELNKHDNAIKFPHSYRRELAALRETRMSKGRLNSLTVALIGALLLLVPLILHWTNSFQKPSRDDHSLVTISIESKPSTETPPQPPATDYATAIVEVALFLAGGTLLFLGVRSRKFATTCAGSLLLLTGLTSTIKNEFKLDKVFGIEKVEINWPLAHPQVTNAIFETIGGVGGYSLGCPDPGVSGTYCNNKSVENKPSYSLRSHISEKPDELFTAICERADTFFIVGHTDRVPLSHQSSLRFESNVGLAQARAENVGKAILEFRVCQNSAKKPTLYTQVGGPTYTPVVPSRAIPARGGYDADRNVAVIWFHNVPSDLPSGGCFTQESLSRSWLVAILILILVASVVTGLVVSSRGKD